MIIPMINLSTDARLSIVLPHMNKALGEAIKNATPEQLEILKEGKDLKSVLNTLFQDKITASKSDTVLLDILKNSAVFKNMGNVNETLSALIKELKTTPEFASKTTGLENFLKNGVTVDTAALKTQIANSGIFMESKFASALQKIPDLTQTLEQLRTVLDKSPLPQSKTLQAQITALLKTPQLAAAAHNLADAAGLAASVKNLETTLHTFVAKNDPLFFKEIAALSQQLDALNTVAELKSALSTIYGSLLQSKASETDPLLDSIEKLLKNLSAVPKEEIKAFSDTLRNVIAQGDISKETTALANKLGEFSRPEKLVQESFLQEAMANDVKSALLSLSDELKASNDPNAPKLLEQVDKLLTQIDYHQLTSYLGASNSLYFPFSWDQLQEGSMAFKKTSDKKFYCEINLRLKEYGELDLMMALYDQNQLEIQAHTEKAELKEVLLENLSELRTLLIDAGLTPRRIRIFEAKEIETPLSETYTAHEDDSDLGFEVKV